jgi:hypothetical protein
MDKLKKILIVDLYEAIEKDDPKVISNDLTYDEFESLVLYFLEKQRGEPTIKEKQSFALDLRIKVTTACLVYLDYAKPDDDIIDVLRAHNWKIELITYREDIDKIVEGVKRLMGKKQSIDNDIKSATVGGKKMSIYEILANMSAGLEGIYLDPRKITAIEFISFQKVLERKADNIDKMKKKSNGIR